MESLTIFSLLFIAFIWHDSMKAREQTLATARRACNDMCVRLIDDTVSLTSIGLKRNPQGRIQIRRIYEFRYLEPDFTIQHGIIILLGDRPESLLYDLKTPAH